MRIKRMKPLTLIMIIIVSNGLFVQIIGQNNNNGLWTSTPPDTVATNR